MVDAPILETRGITVRFGGHVAVENVSIEVGSGTVTGLIGPNGAGKTTLFNTITGLQKPTAGKVFVDGRDVTSLPPYKRARMGLARTFQRLELFVSLSVRDNLRVAGDIHNANTRNRIDVESETDRLLELTGLGDIAHRDVSDIPTGRASWRRGGRGAQARRRRCAARRRSARRARPARRSRRSRRR